MCVTCGCSGTKSGGHDLADAHDHPHGHSHDPSPGHDQVQQGLVRLEEDVLAKNDKLAERNRGWFAGRNTLALNLMSSPGSGKTTLLECTVRDLGSELTISVIGGDQATPNDAERLAATGCKVLQINTGTGCHLDASMIARALPALAPPVDSVLVIENVGNLVCPALFDLGERSKVVLLSVTEGEDKPLKYPHMFRAATLLLLTKIDLLPHLDFEVQRCIESARRVNPSIEVLQLSSRSGQGLPAWYEWLRREHAGR
jgi:hydrogenase nickel incorporation protein HypB